MFGVNIHHILGMALKNFNQLMLKVFSIDTNFQFVIFVCSRLFNIFISRFHTSIVLSAAPIPDKSVLTSPTASNSITRGAP